MSWTQEDEKRTCSGCVHGLERTTIPPGHLFGYSGNWVWCHPPQRAPRIFGGCIPRMMRAEESCPLWEAPACDLCGEQDLHADDCPAAEVPGQPVEAATGRLAP